VIEPRLVGAAESPYLRHPPAGLTTAETLAEAARLALEDAGLEPRDVDGLGVGSFSLAPDRAIDLAVRLGLRVSWLMDSGTGGACGVDMLQHARRAIEAGDIRCALLLAGDVMSAAGSRALSESYNSARRDHLARIGGGSNSLFALLTRRHMRAHGLDRSDYGVVPVAQRRWAAGNPNAAYRSPLSIEDYLGAPLVADPLSLYDCVPVVAGADALVLAASEDGVRIRAVAACHNADQHAGDGLRTGLAELAPALWDEAAASPGDVDVVSVYDDYPVMVLVQLADLGFGEPRALLDEIAARRLPVNTSGGQLSAGQAGAGGGMHGLVEVVRQLRGDAGERQVPGARLGVVTGYGMVVYRYGACANAAVLEGAVSLT
jgi:acetyl-CoA acetyltransferase